MRYLGLDLGTKTLGVAITDKTNKIASPLKVIRFNDSNFEELIEPVQELITNYNITGIALGLPKNMDNSLGFAAERSLKFKELLENQIDIEIELIDERLSTKEAESILFNTGNNGKKRKQIIDGVAATIILETYLKKKGI